MEDSSTDCSDDDDVDDPHYVPSAPDSSDEEEMVPASVTSEAYGGTTRYPGLSALSEGKHCFFIFVDHCVS